ncbi:MAG: OmpA family protein [Myxococcota bacterium]
MKKLVHAAFLASLAILGGAGCCATAPEAAPTPPPPPDADGDGIIDSEDQCPTVAGSAKFGGCIDSDDDGLPDNVDQCPQVKGTVEDRGCLPPPPPDADGDGILDKDDACPQVAGRAKAMGCPDRDMDGIADDKDKCPDQAGVAAEEGCLPKAVQKFAGAIKGITFDAGKATIKKASYKTLDEAVAALQQYPELRLEVQGHTDDQGPDDANMKLSQDRADAVKQYMIDKGIAADRLAATGFGETQPVADNKTAAGRTKNRRIEFHLLGSN